MVRLVLQLFPCHCTCIAVLSRVSVSVLDYHMECYLVPVYDHNDWGDLSIGSWGVHVTLYVVLSISRLVCGVETCCISIDKNRSK